MRNEFEYIWSSAFQEKLSIGTTKDKSCVC